MAKRMTDSNKWKDPWFKKLPVPYKLLWLYILDDCDHAGVWFIDFEVAKLRIGLELEILLDEALELFNSKIIPFDDGNKWFIPSFIESQYGKLNPANKVHKSVLDILIKNNLLKYLDNSFKPLPSSLEAPKDKDMDKDKDKDKFIVKDKDMDKDKDKDKFIVKDKDMVKKKFAKNDEIQNSEMDSEKLYSVFKDFYELYPGKKRKLEIEFENFKKKNEDWKEIIPILIPAIQKEETLRKKAKQEQEFFPQPKYLSTWINKRCWLNEFDDEINKTPTTSHQPPATEYHPFEEKFPVLKNPGLQFLLDLSVGLIIEANDYRQFQKISDARLVEVGDESNEFLIQDYKKHFESYILIDGKII